MCFGTVITDLIGDFRCARPNAELVRADCVELPESDAVLCLRAVLIGMREYEFRLEVVVELEDEGGSREGDRSVPYMLEVGGLDEAPENSLLVLRCKFVGRSGMDFSFLISSNVGVPLRYQADGEDGDISCI